MARSFSNAKAFSVFAAEEISNAAFRRGYAAASQGAASAVTRGGAAAAVMKKNTEESVKSTRKVSWVPDPKTGYYRPENGGNEIDPVELRAMLLNNKKH